MTWMRLDRQDIWLCVDCLVAAVNNDYTGLDYDYSEPESTERMNRIKLGLAELGPHLVPDYDSETGEGVREFSSAWCDCCKTILAGTRHRFATLA
jgi:hypothetical protein